MSPGKDLMDESRTVAERPSVAARFSSAGVIDARSTFCRYLESTAER
jgi:hypothetical protein